MVTDAQFREQFGDLPPGLLAALGKTDLVRLQAGGPPATYLIPSPGLLHIVLALRASGIDLEVAGAAIELLRKHTRRTADDLARFLLDRTGKGFASAGTPEDVTQALAALRTRAMEAVDLLFAQEMERAVRAAFEQGRPRLARTS